MKPTLRDIFPDGDVGLVKSGHHLAYGVRHGHLTWAPDCVKQAILETWNPIACRIWGHDPVEEGDRIACCACCKEWKKP